MRGDAAAYQALGLEPGADQADIDRAYRTLIKRYHPDREGGDAARASAINEAYFQLRKPAAQSADPAPATTVAEALYARRGRQLKLRRKKRARIWPLMLAAIGLIGFLQREKLALVAHDFQAEVQRRIEPSSNDGTEAARSAGPESLDKPLTDRAIGDAVAQASRLHRLGDEDALVETSRACHQKLRAEPSLEQLDGCAAFDNAVLELQRRDLLRDEGPFGAPAITSRQISGATLLSNDYLAIETRLDRVRSRMQLLLAPERPPDAAASDTAQVAP